MSGPRYGVHSLRFKIVLGSVLVEIAMLALLIVNSVRITGEAMHELFIDRVKTMTPLLNASIAGLVAQRDFASLDELLTRIVRHESMAYVEVRDSGGAVVGRRGMAPPTAVADTALPQDDGLYDQVFDVTLAGQVMGRVRYGINVGLWEATLARLRRQGFLIASIEVAASIGLLALLGFLLTRQLTGLVQATQAFATGRFDTRVPEHGRDEIAALGAAFNRMAVEISAQLASVHEGEARLKLATEAADVGLWDWDLRDNGVHLSPQLKRQLGYSDDEMPNRYDEWERRLHPDDRARVFAAVEDALSGKTPSYETEFRLQHKDGSYRHILSRGSPMYDAGGKPYRMLGVHIDITERKSAEAAVREGEVRLRTITEHAPIGIYMADANGDVIYLNRAIRELVGVGPTETLREGWAPLVHPDDRQRVYDAWHDYVRGERAAFDIEYRFKTSRGEIMVHERAAALRDGQRLLGYAGTVEDITARRQAEERLRLAAAVFDHAAEGVLVTDASGAISLVNPAFTEITGYTEDEVRGRNPRLLQSGRHEREFYRAFWDALRQTGGWRGEVWNRRKSGEVYRQQLTVRVMHDANGKIVRYVGIYAPI